MLSDIIKEMQPAEGVTPRYTDILGELFSELKLHDSWKGQFFTPQVVSDMMGEMGIDKVKITIEERGYVSVLEPCVGGGSLVIGLINSMFHAGLNPCKQLLITACDIDIRCIYMSYIHLSLMGVPAIIQQRDFLSGKNLGDTWYTPIFILDGWYDRLRLESIAEGFKKIFSETPTEIEKPVKVENPKPTQLSLF